MNVQSEAVVYRKNVMHICINNFNIMLINYIFKIIMQFCIDNIDFSCYDFPTGEKNKNKET